MREEEIERVRERERKREEEREEEKRSYRDREKQGYLQIVNMQEKEKGSSQYSTDAASIKEKKKSTLT